MIGQVFVVLIEEQQNRGIDCAAAATLRAAPVPPFTVRLVTIVGTGESRGEILDDTDRAVVGRVVRDRQDHPPAGSFDARRRARQSAVDGLDALMSRHHDHCLEGSTRPIRNGPCVHARRAALRLVQRPNRRGLETERIAEAGGRILEPEERVPVR